MYYQFNKYFKKKQYSFSIMRTGILARLRYDKCKKGI